MFYPFDGSELLGCIDILLQAVSLRDVMMSVMRYFLRPVVRYGLRTAQILS